MNILRLRLKSINTLRNQILVVFLFVMMIVLSIVAIMVYNQVGALMKNNAEKQIQQTAVEASGRMEMLYKQIDTLSNQLVTNGTVQQILYSLTNGEKMSLSKREALNRVVRNFLAYSDGISSFELYTKDKKRVYPFDKKDLSSRIDEKWIKLAEEEKGRLVWIGKDLDNPEFSFAIRRVSLIDHWFSNGGYLVIRIANSYFQVNKNSADNLEKEYMLLLDRNLSPITSNYDHNMEKIIINKNQNITIDEKEYMVIKERSQLTGWTIVIVKPISQLMKGVASVRTNILFSGAIGFIIFLASSIYLATMISLPIKRLTNTMKHANMAELKPSPESFSSSEIIELNKTYNQMVEKTNHLIQVVYEKELLRSRTELKALQAQINPHFLYNTLNALYWSLEEKGEEDLAARVIAMSELFRYTIGNSKTDEWVTLQDAIDHIERYLQLMKMRLGDRLEWEFKVADEYLKVKIPKLIIQPLVENAIMHGIENQRKQGFISIRIEKVNDTSNIKVSIQDNGPGIDKETLCKLNQAIENDNLSSFKGIGMALTNVNKRIRLYYEGHSLKSLRIKSEQDVGTTVMFEIPGKVMEYD